MRSSVILELSRHCSLKPMAESLKIFLKLGWLLLHISYHSHHVLFHSAVILTCSFNLSRFYRGSLNWSRWTPLTSVAVLHVWENVSKAWHFCLNASTSMSFSWITCDKCWVVSLNTSRSPVSILVTSFLFSSCSFMRCASLARIIPVTLWYSLFRLLFSLVFSHKTATACSLSKAHLAVAAQGFPHSGCRKPVMSCCGDLVSPDLFAGWSELVYRSHLWTGDRCVQLIRCSL